MDTLRKQFSEVVETSFRCLENRHSLSESEQNLTKAIIAQFLSGTVIHNSYGTIMPQIMVLQIPEMLYPIHLNMGAQVSDMEVRWAHFKMWGNDPIHKWGSFNKDEHFIKVQSTQSGVLELNFGYLSKWDMYLDHKNK